MLYEGFIGVFMTFWLLYKFLLFWFKAVVTATIKLKMLLGILTIMWAPEIESRFFTDSFLFFLTVNVSISDEYHAPRATTTEFAVCVSKLLQMFVLCFHLITSHRHAYTDGAGGNDGCCY